MIKALLIAAMLALSPGEQVVVRAGCIDVNIVTQAAKLHSEAKDVEANAMFMVGIASRKCGMVMPVPTTLVELMAKFSDEEASYEVWETTITIEQQPLYVIMVIPHGES